VSGPPQRDTGPLYVQVRTLARSRGRSGADTCPGPALRSSLGRRPAATMWLVARDISQRAGPGARTITPRSLYIYCREDAPPATTLTSDVPSQHLMCHVQSAGRRRQGHPADNAPVQSVDKQCARAERRTVLIIPSTRSFPCTPRIHRSRMSGNKKIAPAANICNAKCYILYVRRPTCRGPVPLCMPPFGYKRGGMRRYKTDPILGCSIPKNQILKISQTPSKFKMNLKFHFKMFVCKLISTNKI
jgi:hypothetical protein